MNTEVINHSFSARVKKGITTYFKENLAILVAFIILCVGLSIATPAFFTKDNILNVLRQVATNSNLAIGLTMAIIIGGIDLSVGAILAFSGLLCASFISDGMNLGLAVLLAFTLGALFGLLNGLIIAYTNMPPFVVTLATQNIARGIVNVYANGQPISARNPVFNFLGVGYFLGIPLPVIYSFVLLAVMILILGRSKFGRQLYAVGGNEEAARFSGINIKKVKIIVYTLCGALASFSGIILAARMYSGQPTAGDGFELDAIAASVLGGVSFSGGVGKLGGNDYGCFGIGRFNKRIESAEYQFLLAIYHQRNHYSSGGLSGHFKKAT